METENYRRRDKTPYTRNYASWNRNLRVMIFDAFVKVLRSSRTSRRWVLGWRWKSEYPKKWNKFSKQGYAKVWIATWECGDYWCHGYYSEAFTYTKPASPGIGMEKKTADELTNFLETKICQIWNRNRDVDLLHSQDSEAFARRSFLGWKSEYQEKMIDELTNFKTLGFARVGIELSQWEAFLWCVNEHLRPFCHLGPMKRNLDKCKTKLAMSGLAKR